MEERNEIINRVTASPLVTLDLEDFFPGGEMVTFDIKEHLFQDVMLREKDFREFVRKNDWSIYSGKNVAIFCSSDAIVPVWAYMLVATKISPYASHFVFGDHGKLELALWKESLSRIDTVNFADAKVVIKGCGKKTIPEFAFVEAARILWPHVSSIMYGEPCSTVPVYKRAANPKASPQKP
jgi:hypothetical protein